MGNRELTEKQIQGVEKSFETIAPKGAALVASFYMRLTNDTKAIVTELEQHLRQKKLLGLLVLGVKNLRRPEGPESTIEITGVAGAEIGFDPDQHEAWRATFLKTLPRFIGSAWDNELEEAWAAAFDLMLSKVPVSAELVV